MKIFFISLILAFMFSVAFCMYCLLRASAKYERAEEEKLLKERRPDLYVDENDFDIL